MRQSKIAVIGAGVVGSTTAYALMMRNLASKIMLVDIHATKCKGEVLDLSDALPFSSASEIIMGSLKEAGQADIAIITAGIPQKPEQSRMDIIYGMRPINPDLILIIVSNPVDILTYYAQRIAELPKNQIFGSGTLLDTQRLRHLIGEKVRVSPQSVHVNVLGEHGDSQFVAWSTGHIAGIPLLDFPGINKEELATMALKARNKAYDIISCKGSTAFGIASCISTYCHNIIYDTRSAIPVSCYVREFGCCISMPAIIGKNGVEEILMPRLNHQEEAALQKSVEAIKNHISQSSL
jgi:L-lactate dehydrogenase